MSSKKKTKNNSNEEASEEENSESSGSDSSEAESEAEAAVIDEETKQLVELCDKVYAYETMPGEKKLENIKEYKELTLKIKEFEGVVKGYLNRQEQINKEDYTLKKITSNKTYNKSFSRYQELKKILSSDSDGFTVTELQDMLEELKQLHPKIKSYLDKQLEVIYL
jgi:cell fate (sporulation/competence/biofilm development) regulator YmcA (YheA/YmcA/DUF963 family)